MALAVHSSSLRRRQLAGSPQVQIPGRKESLVIKDPVCSTHVYPEKAAAKRTCGILPQVSASCIKGERE